MWWVPSCLTSVLAVEVFFLAFVIITGVVSSFMIATIMVSCC